MLENVYLQIYVIYEILVKFIYTFGKVPLSRPKLDVSSYCKVHRGGDTCPLDTRHARKQVGTPHG